MWPLSSTLGTGIVIVVVVVIPFLIWQKDLRDTHFVFYYGYGVVVLAAINIQKYQFLEDED